MTYLADYDKSRPFTAHVVSSRRLTPVSAGEVRQLVLELVEPDFDARGGQSVGVLVPGPHPFGQDEHFRLYTLADAPEKLSQGRRRIRLLVKRCSYVDEYNGEEYEGIASNYLCDRKAGDEIRMTGPYGLAFSVPENRKSDLLLLSLGTGIAPFRAFIRHVYEELGGWEGRIRLFHGAHSGLELAHVAKDQQNLEVYFDEATFKAFEALSPRPYVDDPVAIEDALERHADELIDILKSPDTHVYVAGIEKLAGLLDSAFAKIFGDAETWRRRKAELVAGERWIELLY